MNETNKVTVTLNIKIQTDNKNREIEIELGTINHHSIENELGLEEFAKFLPADAQLKN